MIHSVTNRTQQPVFLMRSRRFRSRWSSHRILETLHTATIKECNYHFHNYYFKKQRERNSGERGRDRRRKGTTGFVSAGPRLVFREQAAGDREETVLGEQRHTDFLSTHPDLSI